MRFRAKFVPTLGGVAAVLLFCSAAYGQEPINAADSATQPSPGRFIFKEQFRFNAYDVDHGDRRRRGEIHDAVLLSTLNVGITSDVALSFRAPTLFRDRYVESIDGHERDAGVGDVTALAKWRILQLDSGPLDTARLSVIGGAEIRAGDAPFTNDAYNPVLGVAYTQVAGRHGFNGSLQWTFTTEGNAEPILAGESTADVGRYDLAYVFRLSPEEYTADTSAAWYLVCELNGLYETNGDNELFIAPGIMYEARTWTAELSVQAPVWQQIDRRAEQDYALVAGLRFSW